MSVVEKARSGNLEVQKASRHLEVQESSSGHLEFQVVKQ